VQTKVSDVGIQELGELDNLTTLEVFGTRVTAEGKRALQKRLPHLKFSSLESPD